MLRLGGLQIFFVLRRLDTQVKRRGKSSIPISSFAIQVRLVGTCVDIMTDKRLMNGSSSERPWAWGLGIGLS